MNSGALKFLNACRILMNIDRHELVDAGIMRDSFGGNDWTRFNREPLMFLVKLDDEKMEKMWALIESRQPASLRGD